MKITHYSNSFISVKENQTSIICDPWIGYGSENGWLSFPIYKNELKLIEKIKATHVYISHLHCDHFDKKFLKKLNKKKIKIIIKNFRNKRLKDKIRKLGFENILECDEWTKYKINKDISIAIIPQITSNSSDADDAINYDLDTSIIIQSNFSKKIFYNNVDNPLSIKDLIKVKNFARKEFNNKIDLLCTPTGAAGEYPHCFTNINRVAEKQKIVNAHLINLSKQLKALEIKNFFPAGGIYTIYGKFHYLNNLIAEPKENQVEGLCKKLNVNYFNILGGNNLSLKKGKWSKGETNKVLTSKEKIIKKTKNIKYFYEKNYTNFNKKKIDDYFMNSKKNYFKIMKNFKVKSSWKIDFYIYKNLTLDLNKKINKKKSQLLMKYNLNFNKKNSKFSHLKCFLDHSLFEGLLTKKYTWNPALAGSVIIFERKPNIFDPNLTNSLNFLNHNK
jgi:L-ascorbate metabolism protein UlaG (beta-lactamase superfamily)